MKKKELTLARVYKLVPIKFSRLRVGDIALMPEQDAEPFKVLSRPKMMKTLGALYVRVGSAKL